MLAALSIPVYASSAAGGGVLSSGSDSSAAQQLSEHTVTNDADRKKRFDLAQLLRTPLQPGGAGGSLAAGATGAGAAPPPSAMPTREALLAELASASAGSSATQAAAAQRRMLLTYVRPEVAALFRLLEADFCPLQIVQRALPLLAWVQAQTGPTLPQVLQMQIVGGSAASGTGVQSLAQYVPNLQRLLVFRLLEQLSQVYSTVMIPHFQGLIAGLNMSFFDVEKLAVRAVKTRMLAVRIDHRAGTMRLGSEAHETPALRRKLATVAGRLQRVVDSIAPQPEEGATVPQDRREQVFHYARVHTEAHRKEARRRMLLVQKRRNEAEQAAFKKNSEVSERARIAAAAAATAAAYAPPQASCSSVPRVLPRWPASVRKDCLATRTPSFEAARRLFRRSGDRHNWAATSTLRPHRPRNRLTRDSPLPASPRPRHSVRACPIDRTCVAQDAKVRAEQEQLAKVAEEQRLAAEEEARKLAAVQAITEKLEKEKLVALMQAAEGDGKPGSGKNKAADLERFRKLAEEHHDQAALQRAVQEKVMKAKDKEAKERVEQARRVDYLVRALREAERPKVEALLATALQTDELYVRTYNETQLTRKRAVHDEAMRVKARIARMLPYSDAFEEAVLVKRQAEYAKQQVSSAPALALARERARLRKARAPLRQRVCTREHPRASAAAARMRLSPERASQTGAAVPAGTFGCPRTPAAPLQRHPDERTSTPPSRCGAAAGRARDDRPGGSLPTRSLANISCARNSNARSSRRRRRSGGDRRLRRGALTSAAMTNPPRASARAENPRGQREVPLPADEAREREAPQGGGPAAQGDGEARGGAAQA